MADNHLTGREPTLGGEGSTVSGDEPSLPAEIAVVRLLDNIPSGDLETRGHALDVLNEMRQSAQPKLIEVLKSPDNRMRRAAVIALGHIKAENATNALIEALHDISQLVRRAAAEALEAIGSPAVPGLLAAVSDPDPDVQGRVEWLLGTIRDPRVIAYHIAIVRNIENDPVIRGTSIMALGRVGDSSATPTLLDALSDVEPEIREAAAGAFRSLKDIASIPALVDALQDQSHQVRASAARTLGLLRAHEALPGLISMLADDNPSCRYDAADALGQIKAPQGIEPLRRLLHDPMPMIRTAAAHAISEIEE